MKILMTADTVGGVWGYSLELARALEPHDAEIIIASMGDRPDAAQRAEAAAIRNVVLHESEYRLEWQDEPWPDVEAAGEWLLALDRHYGPDVVHLNGYSHGALPWTAPVLVVAHSCVTTWWRTVKGEEAPAEWDEYRRRVAAGASAADHVVAPTRAILEAVETCHGPFRSTSVIPNARRAEHFPPRHKEPFVLAVGRVWDEMKNLGALAAIAGELPWPVRMAGWDASPDGRGAAWTGSAAAPENLQPLGRLEPEALADVYGRASIFAHPARYEPFGLAPLEAALAGCALVLGDIATLREVWGDAAVFVPPDDPIALRDAIRSLAGDATLCATLAARARARALEYTPERMADGYLRLYLDMQSAGKEVLECES